MSLEGLEGLSKKLAADLRDNIRTLVGQRSEMRVPLRLLAACCSRRLRSLPPVTAGILSRPVAPLDRDG